MRDFLGNIVNVGDKVVYITCAVDGFRTGTIVKLNPKTIVVKDSKFNDEHRREYNKIIKIN